MLRRKGWEGKESYGNGQAVVNYREVVGNGGDSGEMREKKVG